MPRLISSLAVLLVMLFVGGSVEAQVIQGMALFEQHCGSCHSNAGTTRAPDREALRERTPEAILEAMTTGVMRENAKALTDAQKRVVAEVLAARPLGAAASGHASAMKNRCDARPLAISPGAPAWSGWGADPGNTRYQPAAAAGLTAASVPQLKLKWAFAFPNASSAYGQPAVAGGRVFVGAESGFVYSLDAASGCVYWSFPAQTGVRTAISVGSVPRNGATRHAVYFGDLRANIYAVDAETGESLWRVRVDDHQLARITGAPTLHDGRLYVTVSSLEEGAGANPNYPCCTFRGSIVVLDAATGKQIWKSYTIEESPRRMKRNSAGTELWGPSGAAIWSSPTIDVKRGAVYVATGNSYTEPAAETSNAVVAFNLKDGKLLWFNQATPRDVYVVGCGPNAPRDNCPDELGPDVDFGNSPMLRTMADGRSVIVIGQKSGVAWALDPDKRGAVLWQRRVGQGSALGGMEWGSAADESVAYFPVADAQHGPNVAGGLHALRLTTGEVVWSARPPAVDCTGNPRACVQAQSAAITVIPGVVFSGATNGMMRAYSTADGKVIWEFNTAREFDTVNGVPGKGGAINGPGPVVVGGMMFTNSGYAYLGQGGAGNVLLAFGVE